MLLQELELLTAKVGVRKLCFKYQFLEISFFSIKKGMYII